MVNIDHPANWDGNHKRTELPKRRKRSNSPRRKSKRQGTTSTTGNVPTPPAEPPAEGSNK